MSTEQVPRDFGFGEDEELLRDVARKFLDENLPVEKLRTLVAADHVLVPCDLSLLSLDGVSAIIETIVTVQETLNPNLDQIGVGRQAHHLAKNANKMERA